MSLVETISLVCAGGGITLAFAVVSAAVPRGPVLTAISDVGYLLLYLAVAGAMLANAWSDARGEPAVLGADGSGKHSLGCKSGGVGLLRSMCATRQCRIRGSWMCFCFCTWFR